MAPFVPFLAESVYQNLVRGVDPDAPESVHMTDWPEADAAWRNDTLLFEIDVVQKVVGLGRAARSQSGVRTRQPCRDCWCGHRTMRRQRHSMRTRTRCSRN